MLYVSMTQVCPIFLNGISLELSGSKKTLPKQKQKNHRDFERVVIDILNSLPLSIFYIKTYKVDKNRTI